MELGTNDDLVQWLCHASGSQRIAAKFRLEFEEFIAEAYLKARQHGWKQRFESGEVAYLHKALLNVARDMCRSTRKGRCEAFPEGFDHLDETQSTSCAVDAASVSEHRRACRNAIEQLPASQRVFVNLVYLDGLSICQCAEKTKTTPAAVRSRLAKARKRLREFPALACFSNDHLN